MSLVTTLVFVAAGAVVRAIWAQVRASDPAQPVLPLPAPRLPVPRTARPTPHKLLAHAQEGEYITLTGQLQASTGSLIAPLSGRECAAYAAAARSVRGKIDAPPSVDSQEMKAAPLVIAVLDGTVVAEGECAVSLRRAPVVPRDIERERGFLVARQLQHYLPSTEFSEAIICVGDPVWVSGVLVHERAGEHGYRDRPVTMRLVGKPGQPLALGRARRAPQVGRPE